MDMFTKEDLEKVLLTMVSMINRSKKIHNKFKEGTPQYSLIRNRLKSLYLSLTLITEELKGKVIMDNISYEDLKTAFPPITSTINKCEKVIEKLEEGTPQSTLTKNMLRALYISLALITRELNKHKS